MRNQQKQQKINRTTLSQTEKSCWNRFNHGNHDPKIIQNQIPWKSEKSPKSCRENQQNLNKTNSENPKSTEKPENPRDLDLGSRWSRSSRRNLGQKSSAQPQRNAKSRKSATGGRESVSAALESDLDPRDRSSSNQSRPRRKQEPDSRSSEDLLVKFLRNWGENRRGVERNWVREGGGRKGEKFWVKKKRRKDMVGAELVLIMYLATEFKIGC